MGIGKRRLQDWVMTMARKKGSMWEVLVVEVRKLETRLGKGKIPFGTFCSVCRLSRGDTHQESVD